MILHSSSDIFNISRTTRLVLQFPPKLSCKRRVRVEFRKGIWPVLPVSLLSANACITFLKQKRAYDQKNLISKFEILQKQQKDFSTTDPNSSKEKLMYWASLSLSPSAFVFFMRSLPAKSQLEIINMTKDIVYCIGT